MNLTIEGKEVVAKEGMSVLDAALEAGIYIPHLCKHPDLEAIGGCRLCMVEIEGQDEVVPSCMTEVKEGMSVKVRTDKADEVRKMSLELILASHPADCTGCPKYGNCELQSVYQYLGVSPEGWKLKSRAVPNNTSNPLIEHSFTRCIRCGRCVRACQELRGVKVLDYRRTKEGIRIGTVNDQSLEDAGCMFCGACVEVCPTGAITDMIRPSDEGMSQTEAIVPCKAACPAHTDVPRYVRYIKEGQFAKATAVVREKVPFPDVLGSVCNHVCEDHCKRNEFENPISVCKLKKAAAVRDDGKWKERAFRLPSTGKKVAVIGAGPAGMTSAYFLAKKGHDVKVFEANERAGGQCSYGIPAYRLPNQVVDHEIDGILAEGVDLQLNTKIDKPIDLLQKGYDAVLVATGTHMGTKLPIEGHDLSGVMVNAEFLKLARQGKEVNLGDRVMVLGGGNVAYDCGRTALRLGAKEVHIACLENDEQMTASKEEIEEGREEGVILHSGHSFLKIVGQEKVEGVELQQVKSFTFDKDGKANIELIEGSEQVIPLDTVIFAVGQKPEGTQDMGLDLFRGAYIVTGADTSTNVEGVFAAGDVVTGTKSVIEAITGGRRSAMAIDAYLGGDGDITENLLDVDQPNPFIGRVENFTKQPRVKIQLEDPGHRVKGFDMVEKVLTEEAASCEAGRCLQCDLRLKLNRPKVWNEF